MSTDKNVSENNVSLAINSNRESDFIFLGTVIINMIGHQGKLIEARGILDNGSQVNFITERLANELELRSKLSKVNVSGIGAKSGLKTTKMLQIEITSLCGSYRKNIDFIVIPKISSYSPNENIDLSAILKKKRINIPLADPNFNESRPIDVLLNVQVYTETNLSNEIKLGENLPSLYENKFGWIAYGSYRSNDIRELFCGAAAHDNPSFDDIPNLWKLDEPHNTKLLTQEEMAAENHFKNTTYRDKLGRFVVELPKNEKIQNLGESIILAKSRFKCLEKRFNKNPELFLKYKQFLQEYLDLNHMSKVEFKDIQNPRYFLPHHPVFKADSSTTKLRVVFDASARSSTNFSLNDCLLNGPQVQDELFTILCRFRFPKYVFTADLAKMYRQIRFKESDQNLQLILWRNHQAKNFLYIS